MDKKINTQFYLPLPRKYVYQAHAPEKFTSLADHFAPLFKATEIKMAPVAGNEKEGTSAAHEGSLITRSLTDNSKSSLKHIFMFLFLLFRFSPIKACKERKSSLFCTGKNSVSLILLRFV